MTDGSGAVQAAPTAEEFAALRAELAELRQERLNPAPTGDTKYGRKPDCYEGSRKPRAVENWIKSLDEYFELNPSQCRTDRIAVLTAATYLTEPAKGDYNAYTSANGDFENWAAMKTWLLQTFNPIDAENTYSVNWFYRLRQGDNETPDAYYRRFSDATNLLPHKLPDYYVRFHFAHTLLPYYKTPVLSDTELAKWEKPVDAIVSKMKRLPIPSGGGAMRASVGTNPSIGSGSSNSSSSQLKKRKLTTSEATGPGNQHGDPRSHSDKKSKSAHDDTPLTGGQRKFLDQNIAKGGGIVVSETVQNKSAWVKEAKERRLCIRCAGSGHFQNECPATRQSVSGATSTSSLNAMLPGATPLNGKTQL
jgi:Retrotransposon gag protein